MLDPSNATGGAYPSAQIIWDAFQDRFSSGAGAILLLIIPLVCMYFCCWFSITSASRWVLSLRQA